VPEVTRIVVIALAAVAVSVAVAMIATWAGLFIAFYEPPPGSFFIVSIAFVFYLIVRSMDVLQGSVVLRTRPVPEKEALRTLNRASLLGVAAQVMLAIGVALVVPVLLSNGSLNPAMGGVTSSGWATLNVVYVALGLIAAGAAVGVAAYLVYFLGFRKVRRVEPGLGPPTVLVLLGIMGFALAFGREGLLYGGVASAYGAPSGPAAQLAALGGLMLLGIGLFLAFLGSVGLAMGNWRTGHRYQEETIKVGGFVAFLPIVSMIGFALCSVGYTRARRKLAGGWEPPPR
jgi:hypothetical protein